MIHPAAIVDPRAVLGAGVEVGPYAVIEAGVELGEGCRVGPGVHLLAGVTAGPRNAFHAGCVIGGPPQDLKWRGEPTGLRIGEGNVFREHVTIHRSNRPDEDTVVGSFNYFMAHSHAGHNARVGDHNLVANGALLAGHVEVGDRAFISGNCLVHQFCRVGSYALMQGGAAISKDLPPATVARGDNGLGGLNVVGLRRAGVSAEERLALRRVYLAVFRGGKNIRAAAEAALRDGLTGLPRAFAEFILASRRGVVAPRRDAAGQTKSPSREREGPEDAEAS